MNFYFECTVLGEEPKHRDIATLFGKITRVTHSILAKHEYMKGDIAIGFPHYSSKVVGQNHLGFGSKMRLFCESKEKLANFVEIFLPIIKFQFSNSINVGRIKPVPDHLISGYEAFFVNSDRTKKKLYALIYENEPNLKPYEIKQKIDVILEFHSRFKERVEATMSLPLLPVISSTKREMKFFIRKEILTEKNQNKTTSYGFSNKETPVSLPIFP